MVVNNAMNRFYHFIFYIICDRNTISVGVEVVNRSHTHNCQRSRSWRYLVVLFFSIHNIVPEFYPSYIQVAGSGPHTFSVGSMEATYFL